VVSGDRLGEFSLNSRVLYQPSQKNPVTSGPIPQRRDKEKRRQGEEETGRRGDRDLPLSSSPCLLVSLSQS
jgi:hypothetical protein